MGHYHYFLTFSVMTFFLTFFGLIKITFLHGDIGLRTVMISRFFRFLFSGGRKQEKEKKISLLHSPLRRVVFLSRTPRASFFSILEREKKRNAPFGPRQFTHLYLSDDEKVGDLERLGIWVGENFGKLGKSWEKLGKRSKMYLLR